jgi:hypothetical protein
MRTKPLIVCLLLLYESAANATMPSLSPKPPVRSLSACQGWAAKQSDDAIEMWGILEHGSTSRDIAVGRLTRSCMGGPAPEIVGFGSSAGFNQEYCRKHQASKICKDSTVQALKPEDTILTVKTTYGDLFVVRDVTEECGCSGWIQFRSTKIRVGSNEILYAVKEGIFSMREGDVVVVSVPSGLRGAPPQYYVLLVQEDLVTDLTAKNEKFTSEDWTFNTNPP